MVKGGWVGFVCVYVGRGWGGVRWGGAGDKVSGPFQQYFVYMNWYYVFVCICVVSV